MKHTDKNSDAPAGCSLLRADVHRISRRSMLLSLSTALVALAAPLAFARGRKLAIPLDSIPKLNRVGGFALLKIKGELVLVARVSKTKVIATHAICPHKRFKLGYDKRRQKIVCKNHGSTFTVAGKVTKGPAKKNIHPVHRARLSADGKRILLTLLR